MPNVLAHAGVQGPGSRLLSRKLDPRWIYLGLVIPDIPWIVRRALTATPIPVAPYSLRLYAHAQASLAVCLLLAASIAFFANRAPRVFSALSLNVLLHLLLDATQRKWGNGVHILAPFDWDLWSLDFFWPENPLVYALSLFGLVFLVWEWTRGRGKGGSILPVEYPSEKKSGSPGAVHRRLRWVAGSLFLIAYLLVPLLSVPVLWSKDLRSTRTLAQQDDRRGRVVEFDRVPYHPSNGAGHITIFTGEEIAVRGDLPDASTVLSVRGRFVAPDTLRVQELHAHHGRLRDHLSLIGLLLIVLAWIGGSRKATPGVRPDGR